MYLQMFPSLADLRMNKPQIGSHGGTLSGKQNRSLAKYMLERAPLMPKGVNLSIDFDIHIHIHHEHHHHNNMLLAWLMRPHQSGTYRWRYMVIYATQTITGYNLRASKVPSILVRKN